MLPFFLDSWGLPSGYEHEKFNHPGEIPSSLLFFFYGEGGQLSSIRRGYVVV